MFLRKEKRKGRLYLSIVETYVEPDTKKHKTRYIQTLGYLDELEQEFDDPIAHFKQVAQDMTQAKKAQANPITLQINPSEVLPEGQNSLKNFGYLAVSSIYRELGIDRFFSGRQRKLNASYNLNRIFRLLIHGRAICPGSKKQTYENRNRFFDKSDFSLDDLYRSLGVFGHYAQELQKWLFQKVCTLYGRDTSIAYYDVTNYYFAIDENDEDILDQDGTVLQTGFRKKGVSKEHQTSPIVQMGLFMDSNSLPISYELFDGNTNDTLTLRPALKQACMQYGLGKVIVVADKGLNSGDNIYYLRSGGNGYVLSKSIRGADASLKEYVLEETGYVSYGEDFKIKSKPIVRTISVSRAGGGTFKHAVEERLVVFYSEQYAKRAKKQRQATLSKAADLVSNPAKYHHATSHGAAKYVKGLSFVEETGELAEGCILQLDEERIQEEEAYDGYYAIVSSEVETPAEEIVELYRGLWQIEESFKITKDCLDSRPVHVERKSHIEAHFLTCFVTLLIGRILQMKTGGAHSVHAIVESLRKSNCVACGQNYYQLTYYDAVLRDIGAAIGMDFSKKYRTNGEIKKIFKSS